MTLDAQSTEPAATQLRQGIALALSGGGYRAMLFHTGALIRLNELGLSERGQPRLERFGRIDRCRLSRAGLETPDVEGRRRDQFARHLCRGYPRIFRGIPSTMPAASSASSRQGFLVSQPHIVVVRPSSVPWRDAAGSSRGLRRARVSSSVRLISRQDRCGAFRGPTWRTGAVGRILNPDFSLARAVAASSAFPPALSPMRLDLEALRRHAMARAAGHSEIRPPMPAFVRSRAVLTDGGIVRQPWARTGRGLAHFAGERRRRSACRPKAASYWNWYTQAKRVLDVEDNQVRALRRRRLIERFQDDRAARDSDEGPTGRSAPIPISTRARRPGVSDRGGDGIGAWSTRAWRISATIIRNASSTGVMRSATSRSAAGIAPTCRPPSTGRCPTDLTGWSAA